MWLALVVCVILDRVAVDIWIDILKTFMKPWVWQGYSNEINKMGNLTSFILYSYLDVNPDFSYLDVKGESRVI